MCLPEWRRARIEAQHLSDLALLRRIRDRIDGQYAQPLNVETLARGVHMPAGHLTRQFQAAYGASPYAYLMTRRIERAAALLRRGDLGVAEVCRTVGCPTLGTFTTRFTELVGIPPETYRHRTADNSTEVPARDPGHPIRVEHMPACVARQVARPVRIRDAEAAW